MVVDYNELLDDGFRWDKLTAENITSDEVIEALGDPELDPIEYEQNKFKLLLRAKELKCLSDTRNFLKGLEKKEPKKKEIQPQTDMQNYVTANLGQGEVAIPCGEWYVDDTGVWKYNMYHQRMYACRKPVIITRKLYNEMTQKYKYELAYRDRYGQLRTAAFSCAWLLNANKVQGLSDYGISMTSTESKHFTDYLSDFEGCNELPTANSTDKLGWFKHDFVPYNKAVTFDAEAQFQELYTAIMEHSGSPEAWVEYVQDLRATKRSEIFISLAASFASPLLHLINGLPFICNMYGTTGKGKTVCLYLAASIWGNPNIYISDSCNTTIANEIRLSTLNHLPMMLDDFSKISTNKFISISDIIYNLCSGMGKSRSNTQLTLNDQKRWKCTILTNMERPLVENITKGGSINRVLDFAMEDGPIFKSGNNVVSFLEDNYGYAGEDFITALISLMDKNSDYIKKRYRYWSGYIYDSCNRHRRYSDKQIASLAVMFLADELSEKIIFKDGLGMCKNTKYYITQLKNIAEVEEGSEGYEYLLQCIFRDINMFEPQNKDIDDNTYHGKVGGNIDRLNNGSIVINVMVEQFRKYMKDGNFSEKTTIDWIIRNNLLYGYQKGTRRQKRKTVIRNYAPYCYSILIEGDEKDTDFAPVEDEDLPFDD